MYIYVLCIYIFNIYIYIYIIYNIYIYIYLCTAIDTQSAQISQKYDERKEYII